jgi:hypothetical protein
MQMVILCWWNKKKTFRSKGDRIVRVEEESMRRKPFQYVFDALVHYAKIQSYVQLTMLHVSYVTNMEDIPLALKSSNQVQKTLQKSH